MIFNQRVKIRFVQDFEVPPSIVFGFFSNHESLSKIYPGAFKRVVNSIDPRNANGIGSVRRITNFPLVFEETITQYNEPSFIKYKITAGATPIKNHIGQMHFLPLESGKCRLDYTIEFDPILDLPFQSFLLKNIMEKMVGDAVRELAKRFKENPRY